MRIDMEKALSDLAPEYIARCKNADAMLGQGL